MRTRRRNGTPPPRAANRTFHRVMLDNDKLVGAVKEAALRAADAAALLSETVALLRRERRHYNWVGVYLLRGDTLVLGPYEGKPTPHTRIPLDQGICGAAASTGASWIVNDVRADPRYLACSLETRSEIVVPIARNGAVLGEIDVDSDLPAAFTPEDKALLEAVALILAGKLP